MVAWQTDDVLILHYDRLSASNYTRPYIGVYAPDGTPRGYIDPIGAPPNIFAGNAAFQYQMKYADNFVYLSYSGFGFIWYILSIDQDGNVQVFSQTPNNSGFTLHMGIARDASGNIYHLDGNDFNRFAIAKRDPNGMLIALYPFEKSKNDDPNLFSTSGSNNQASTLEYYDNILYFNGVLNSLGVFITSSPYGINRIDTTISSVIPFISLNDALITGLGWMPGTQSISMLQWVIDRNGNIVSSWENETLGQFAILRTSNLGDYLSHFLVFPQNPNDVGNAPEIDFISLSNDGNTVWVCEHGGPMVAYNLLTGVELYRWHYQININTRLDFAFTVVTDNTPPPIGTAGVIAEAMMTG